MNKQKFENKCKEIYAHEDEMLAKMNELIKPYNEELNKRGCKINCRLLWLNTSPDNDGYMLFERPALIQYRHYKCTMNLQFGEVNSVYDENGFCETGFEFCDDVTHYTFSLLFGWHFKKYKMKWIFDSAVECYKLIMEKGLEQASKEALDVCKVRSLLD